MSVTDEALQPSSDSFWEVDCYKRTVKRHEDGSKLCHDLSQLIQERADIEKSYAKSLRVWSKKWNELIEKGPEYGTTQAAWKGCLSESERIADIHTGIKDKLLNDVQSDLKMWSKTNYHKAMVGPCKETKELEDGFKKAQKPWAKRLSKVMKTRKDFHTACKLEKTATNQENNARSDSGISPDQLKKIQDKADKCRKEVDSTRVKYEQALKELNEYNAKYMEDMTEVFVRSQEYEEKRLKYFKEILYGVHGCLNISESPELPEIYQQLHSTISVADFDKDLKWWSNNHGIDMSMNWPVFEEYSPEMHTISRKERKAATTHDGGITLTNIQQKNDAPPAYSSTAATQPPPQQIQQPPPPVTSNGMQNSQNPFGDEEWEDDAPLEDTEGVPVRAIYEYEGQEEDELSFKIGEVFVKLKDRDDQGWCTGRKDGRTGLYPDNYVETI